MDTIIFIVLLIGAVFAAMGAKAKVFLPIFAVGFILTAVLFNYHVTSNLPLSF